MAILNVTLNPNVEVPTLSNNNLTATMTSAYRGVNATHSKASGKWYWEVKVEKIVNAAIGIIKHNVNIVNTNVSYNSSSIRAYRNSGLKLPNSNSYADSYSTGDIIGVALDLDNQKLEFYKNGVNQGVSHDDLEALGEVSPFMVTGNNGESVFTINFGASPFEYSIPEGYYPYALEIVNRVLIESNNQKYRFIQNIWQPVGNTEQSFLDYGMNTKYISSIPESAWQELTNPVISYYTDDPDKEEITIETETKPFTIYDETGDSMEVLYYTDDPDKEEAKLDVVANYSPLDEFEEFEVVTWTDNESQESMTLGLNALPHEQLVFSESDISAELIESLTINATGVKIIASADQGSTWHTFYNGSWKAVETDREIVKEYGMTSEEFNALTKEQLGTLLKESNTLRFAYYLEQDQPEDEVYADNISVSTKPAASTTPILEGIQIDYDELTIEGRMKDLEEKNAINMNKLNFKANALMQSEKYELHDLVIDTFESDSMITKEGIISLYQQSLKAYRGIGTIQTEEETFPEYAKNLIISAEYSDCIIEYSFDGGTTWEDSLIDQVIDISSRKGNRLVIRAQLPNENSELRSLAYGWA